MCACVSVSKCVCVWQGMSVCAVWQRLADRFVRAGFRGVVLPLKQWQVALGKGVFVLWGMLQARKTLIFRHSTFGLVFAAALCVLLTLRIRSVRGKGGDRQPKVLPTIGRSPKPRSRSLSVFAILSARCFLTLLFVCPLSIAIILASRSLSLCVVLSVCLWLCFVFSQKENK